MKKLQNPTTFFFKQAENITNQNNAEIEAFVAKLINKDVCLLCKKNYDTKSHIPRIMIHCGHTFCTKCLNQFYMNRRVRCPMCLKLVKQIDNLDRLPINHTIFKHIVQKQNNQNINEGNIQKVIDPQKFLFGEFQRVQKQAHMLQNPQKIDPDSGLPFCVFHPDRVEHFYCESHKGSGCRVCIQIGHSKPDCVILDLYNVQDPQKYLNPNQRRIDEPDVSEPFINMNDKSNGMLGLNDDDDDQQSDEDLVNDDSSPQRKSI